MKSNKHPHHDLIVEWSKDTSKVVQHFSGICKEWVDVAKNKPIWDFDIKYRFKPREFQKGHWYPCADKDGERRVYMFDGDNFAFEDHDESLFMTQSSMKWIGESLGEIKFGGEE